MRARGFENCVERVKRLDDKRTIGLRKINRGDEDAATTNGPRVLRKTWGCNADDAMMNATSKIKHMTTTTKHGRRLKHQSRGVTYIDRKLKYMCGYIKKYRVPSEPLLD